ncbi:hypothetical protein F53441_13484 [Fusarium austroafricanum]|uniref:Uncharacterized protein n=1 Tax=Fusarium austroafricanum TaxID=2364996 RepID=A0A8H4JR28_9HYPO|nr:hypothetical protein F53441_13484 [Fusarium austroafricanum]
MTSMSWTALLRSSITAFCQELQHLKEPDAVLREELAVVKDRSRRRLESFALHPTVDGVPSLQQELLADGWQMRDLELAHVASRAQRLELYDEAMEELAGRMLREQFNILGLAAIQKLVPELSASLDLDEDDSVLLCSNDGQTSVAECQPNNVAVGDAHVQAPHHEKRWDDESCQTVRPNANTSVTWCTLRRRDQADPHGNSGRERIYRAMTRRAPLRQRTARNHRENSPSPLATGVQVLHQHDDSEKALIRKRSRTLCNKAMNMGVDGRTTCILVFKNPVHDEWVSAGHIPEGQTIPSLDAIVVEHMGRCQEVGTDSPSIKVENSSPNTAMGRERDYMNMISFPLCSLVLDKQRRLGQLYCISIAKFNELCPMTVQSATSSYFLFLYGMAGPTANLTTRLRDAIGNWNKHLQGIKDPDDVFRQERARISDASKKRIEEFYLNTLQGNDNNNNDDNVALLLRALLSDGQQMQELEVEHEGTRAKKQELQDEGARTVGRRIVADVIDILGLSAVQHLMPAVPSSPEEATSTTKDYVDSASLAVHHGSDAPPATMGLTTRTRSYNTRKNGGARQKMAPSIGPPVSKGDSSLKRKHQPDRDDERDIKQEKKTPRVSARQTPSSAGKANFDSVRPLPAPYTSSGDLLQHSNEKGVISARRGMKSQYKNIRLDVNRRSARVMLQRHPFRPDLWVCLIFVPPDHANMSLDTMVNRSIMPALVQFVNRRRTANGPEGQAALGAAQPPVNTRSSFNNVREREGEGEGEEEAEKNF